MIELDSDTYSDISETKYSDKKQLTAFLLSFLGGFGAGKFYVGDNGVGSIKLIFTMCLCCTFCICFFVTKSASFSSTNGDIVGREGTNQLIFRPYVGTKGISTLIACCGLSAVGCWWLYDVVLLQQMAFLIKTEEY